MKNGVKTMKADCHIHMVLDGADWRGAIDRHRASPDRALIRQRLQTYAAAGFDYLRDGGDKWGVGAAARELAGEYGITYRTPLAPLICAGHYGSFIGEKYENLREYAALVRKRREQGADFIKIMISGIMDFDRYGKLSEEGLDPALIRELIHIAHEEGFAVMAHANGARTVEAAALAGVDSIEHGAYLDMDALHAMKENGTVWCPTLSAIGNLRGTGRFDEKAVSAIYESAVENLRRFAKMDGLIAPGSDAGAWSVSHTTGGNDEYGHLSLALGDKWKMYLDAGTDAIFTKFQPVKNSP
jgi:imidazolonepropionase-like amidohydrolase